MIYKKRQPVIGIPSSPMPPSGSAIPPKIGQNQAYVDAVLRAGGVPILLPLLNQIDMLRCLHERIDGLLLAGGEDVDPAQYGELRHERCGRVAPDRDEMEIVLARWSIEEEKPLLAICRGIQVLNVALGGSLYQDIASQLPDALKHDWFPGFPRDHLSHRVDIDKGSQLAGVLGAPSVEVNSLHHQAIKDASSRLTVVGRAPDGITEAVELKNHPFALGVQWHPEELTMNGAREQRLFDALVKACMESGDLVARATGG